MSALDALASELGDFAAGLARELELKVTTALAEHRAAEAERALQFERFMAEAKAHVAGLQGERGEKGDVGPQGERGERGEVGPQGERGLEGPAGPAGADGKDGEAGPRGEKGDSGPQGEPGARGEKGEKGDTGDRGEAGPQGERGLPGEAGPRGERGEKGDAGPSGADGLPGERGVAGERGEAGEKGERGEPGERGPVGERGEAGPQGERGLAGEAGPRGEAGVPGKLQAARAWVERVHYDGDVVTHDGSLYQAQRDTGRKPPHEDWLCLASRGAEGKDAKSFNPVGLYRAEQDYAEMDVVGLNGGSFVALKDDPGPCPGDGWRLIASPGRRGEKGERGERGAQGERGAPGASIESLSVDDQGLLTAVSADGSRAECDLYPILSRLG